MRAVVYSAIYGGYDTPKSVFDVGGRCVLFTDNPDIHAPGWEVHVDPLEWISTSMLRAKFWKTHPERIPNADISVWIDGSLTPGHNFLTHCLEALGQMDAAFTPHPLRDCIYDELKASVVLPKYRPEQMERQVAYYRKMGHPENWGLIATGAMVRRHSRRVIQLSTEWWNENVTWSWQDQLSLPYVLRRHPEILWGTTLPWAQWWGYAEHHG